MQSEAYSLTLITQVILETSMIILTGRYSQTFGVVARSNVVGHVLMEAIAVLRASGP
jgi:hypothetical protein